MQGRESEIIGGRHPAVGIIVDTNAPLHEGAKKPYKLFQVEGDIGNSDDAYVGGLKFDRHPVKAK